MFFKNMGLDRLLYFLEEAGDKKSIAGYVLQLDKILWVCYQHLIVFFLTRELYNRNYALTTYG